MCFSLTLARPVSMDDCDGSFWKWLNRYVDTDQLFKMKMDSCGHRPRVFSDYKILGLISQLQSCTDGSVSKGQGVTVGSLHLIFMCEQFKDSSKILSHCRWPMHISKSYIWSHLGNPISQPQPMKWKPGSEGDAHNIITWTDSNFFSTDFEIAPFFQSVPFPIINFFVCVCPYTPCTMCVLLTTCGFRDQSKLTLAVTVWWSDFKTPRFKTVSCEIQTSQ